MIPLPLKLMWIVALSNSIMAVTPVIIAYGDNNLGTFLAIFKSSMHINLGIFLIFEFITYGLLAWLTKELMPL